MIRTLDLTNQNEINQVMRIWLFSNLDAHPFINKNYWQSHFDEVQAALTEAEVYVEVRDNIITGFIGLVKNYIAGLFVKREFRHQGIGTQLLKYVQAKYSTLTLEVYKQNTTAVAFYRDFGFKIINEQIESETGALEYIMKF